MPLQNALDTHGLASRWTIQRLLKRRPHDKRRMSRLGNASKTAS